MRSAARAYAALGNVYRAVAAIHAAENAWNSVEPNAVDELGGICTFNQARTLYYAADATDLIEQIEDFTHTPLKGPAQVGHGLARAPRLTHRPRRHPAGVPQRGRGPHTLAIVGDDRVTHWLYFDSRDMAAAQAMVDGAAERAQHEPRTEYYLAVTADDELVGFAATTRCSATSVRGCGAHRPTAWSSGSSAR